jgi:hypothetical protein
MMTSALLESGIGHIREVLSEVRRWMEERIRIHPPDAGQYVTPSRAGSRARLWNGIEAAHPPHQLCKFSVIDLIGKDHAPFVGILRTWKVVVSNRIHEPLN